MHGSKTTAAAFASIVMTAASASAQVEKSRVDIPFFLEGAAAELAAKMIFICGGGSGGGATGPVRYTVTVKHAEPSTPLTLSAGGIPQATVVTSASGKARFQFGANGAPGTPLDFDPFGALVQVAQGSTIVLSGTMLAGAPGVSVCTPSEATTPLTNLGVDPDGSGDTRVRTMTDCDRDFQVEIEEVPVGAYEVMVGGVVRGTLTVVDVDGETEGELEFDTDADEPGELPLDFDPVGQTVEVRQGATVFFSNVVGAPGGPGTCGEVLDEPDLTNVGPDGDADGKARFRQELDCDRDFRVEAEDLPVGDYEVVVGGIVRGTLTVADLGGGVFEGELELDNEPDQPGELLLDFDPRGLLVEVRQGATVFLSVTMPD